MPVAVPLIGAAAAIGGGALAASSAKSAANKAAAAQTASAQMAIDAQNAQYQQTRSDLQPWQQAGTAALGQQGDLLGLNGTTAQQSSINSLKASPLYQSLFGNGQDAVLQNASATGGLRGGNTANSLANFGRDTLATTIQNQLTNLGGVSEQGQNAAAQTGQFGANAANQISSLLGDQGAAQAGAATAAGAANAALIKSIAGGVTGLAGNQAVQSWAGKLF